VDQEHGLAFALDADIELDAVDGNAGHKDEGSTEGYESSLGRREARRGRGFDGFVAGLGTAYIGWTSAPLA
jgi:hypothetical protein